MNKPSSLAERAGPFLAYLEEWSAGLPTLALADLVADRPERVAVFSIDMINGFCNEGPLAGPRVQALIAPVVRVFERAHALGVRNFVLTQDTHDPQTPEFAAYPPHCIAGTAESQAVAELRDLPFADQVVTIEKNSLSSHLATRLPDWLREHPELDIFVLVGDCTDLCIYSAAMHLRMEANALNLQRRIVVPAEAVDTYDTPVGVARELGIKAHDGDLHHLMFLHHMAANGIEVVADLT
jgi:nicotinamidase-related amidase